MDTHAPVLLATGIRHIHALRQRKQGGDLRLLLRTHLILVLSVKYEWPWPPVEHNYVVSRSFTFPLGRAGPPCGFGLGVDRKDGTPHSAALAFVALPVSLSALLGSTRL